MGEILVIFYDWRTYAGFGSLFALIMIIALIASPKNSVVPEVTTAYIEETKPEVCGIESLHIFDEKGSIYFGNDPKDDAYGKTHTGSYLSIWTLNNKNDEKNGYIGYIDLVTGNNYKTFSGVFFPRAEMRNEQTIELFIYADNELVYSSGVINRQVKPIEFNININQCDILRIEVFTVDYYYASTTGCASQLFIFDGKVSK